MPKRVRPQRIPTPNAAAREARCGVPGCLHVLPIDPSKADQPYVCPCPRRIPQEVYLDQRQATPRWKLIADALALRPDRGAKEEYNLIAHALVTGQVVREGRRVPVDLAPSEHATRQQEAFLEAFRHYRQAALLLTRGHAVAALDAAERGLAANVAYDLHSAALTREKKQHDRGALWQGGRAFWVDLPVRRETVTLDAGNVGREQTVELPHTMRFTFEFLAVEGVKEVEVINGEDIERASGVNVGPDGWRDLVRLLTRLEEKPGEDPDRNHLIYRRKYADEDWLHLRPHVKRYPRALTALEALRRTLTPLVPRQSLDAALSEWYGQGREWLHDQPDWVRDFDDDHRYRVDDQLRERESAYQRKRRLRREGEEAHCSEGTD